MSQQLSGEGAAEPHSKLSCCFPSKQIPAHSDFNLASAKCRLATPNCAQRHWQPCTIPTLSPR